MKLVMNRNTTVSSTSGHAIRFEKGVPVNVPAMLVSECMAKGAIPDEGEKVPVPEEVKKDVPPPMGAERVDIVEMAFDEMVAKNARGSFSANGVPKADDLRNLLDFPIDGNEIKALWVEYKAKQTNGE